MIGNKDTSVNCQNKDVSEPKHTDLNDLDARRHNDRLCLVPHAGNLLGLITYSKTMRISILLLALVLDAVAGQEDVRN